MKADKDKYLQCDLTYTKLNLYDFYETKVYIMYNYTQYTQFIHKTLEQIQKSVFSCVIDYCMQKPQETCWSEGNTLYLE